MKKRGKTKSSIEKKGKKTESCSKMEAGLDRFSDLPNEVIEKILSNLDMKEGARTSVLSKKWRYKWAMVPHLVFRYRSLVGNLGGILSSHTGPIRHVKIEGSVTGSKFELACIRQLLVSSPAIETMTVVLDQPEPVSTDDESSEVYTDDETQDGAVKENQSCSFTQLRHVKMSIYGVEAELNLINFLLMSSPVLETLTVVLKKPKPDIDDRFTSDDSDCGNSDSDSGYGFRDPYHSHEKIPEAFTLQCSLILLKKLTRFKRASPHLELIYTDYLD